MSSGTAAQPPETATANTAARAATRSPRGPGAAPTDRPPAQRRAASEPAPEHRASRRIGSNRAWSALTVAAAVAFCVALVFGATRLLVDVADVSDTPERTVGAFLEALLDRQDAGAAASWLCADKADRDLSEAVARMSFTDAPGTLEWSEVTETARSVGAATVTAEIRIGGDAAGALSTPTTWVFSLVAEEGDPQWLICGIAAE
ncbi:hypothetical protein [Glycomyces sp. NRRL B-16210]|uniref:hypothetical protein n=1 Tax=Glycomyces sp. NRRL B-16210 TaxID=1463821 RepID=UPI0004BECF82|nr:hypothetical protein [Glycomyces sp. NRRL B-16210]